MKRPKKSQKQNELIEDIETQLDSAGNETEEDLKTSNFGAAVTWATDWTTETVFLQLSRGVIELSPGFQRRDAWRTQRKSRFIESLILGLPIPQIVLAEKPKKGNFLVIDGKQRLLTISQFCSPSNGDDSMAGFKLEGLVAESDLNGKTYEDLSKDPKFSDKIAALHSQTIRTVVIKNWPNEDFLYTVFLRLNSNSVALSPQELRKALHPGKFITFVENESGTSHQLLKLLRLTKPDFRMRDVEITVRYYAFHYFSKSYSGNLKQFLDETCQKLNSRWISEERAIREKMELMNNAITVSETIFGAKNAFRKYSEDGYEPRLNRAVLDIFLYFFSIPSYAKKALAKKKEVKESFERLCLENTDFIRSLETSTKSTDSVHCRFNTWGKRLSKVLDIQFKSVF